MRRWFSQPGSGATAQRRLGRILGAIGRLADLPNLGQPGDYPGTRRLIVENHIVVYRLLPDTGETVIAGDVYVLRIFEPGQTANVYSSCQ